MEVAQVACDKSGFHLRIAANEMAVCHACNAHVQKLVGGPLAGHANVEIITRQRASPRAGSVPAATVQREDAHRAAHLRQLKCGLLFFAERAQFARAARDHLFRNLIEQLRRRGSRARRKRKYVQVRKWQALDERERCLMVFLCLARKSSDHISADGRVGEPLARQFCAPRIMLRAIPAMHRRQDAVGAGL